MLFFLGKLFDFLSEVSTPRLGGLPCSSPLRRICHFFLAFFLAIPAVRHDRALFNEVRGFSLSVRLYQVCLDDVRVSSLADRILLDGVRDSSLAARSGRATLDEVRVRSGQVTLDEVHASSQAVC